MEKLTPESGSIEPRKIRFGRVDVATDSATEIKEMPFPTQRVLHWKPLFRNPDSDNPPPVRILISQEILILVNNHVAQSLDTEIGGFLLGNRYYDTSSGVNFIIIDQYVEALFTESTSVSLSFTMDAWRRLKEDLSGKFIGKALVGWYHSHPRMDVFLSDFDLHIHEERFKEPWMMALVIEPEKWLGGFFVWRDGKINSRNPVEFYEYLPGEAGRIKETGSPWINYFCYNDATGLEQDVPRMQNALPVIAESQLDAQPSNWFDRALDSFKMFLPEGLQKFAFPIVFVLAILLAIGIALVYIFISSGPTKPSTEIVTTVDPSPLEQAFSLLDLIERDRDAQNGPEVKILSSQKVEARKALRGQEVVNLNNDLEIYLFAKKIPDRAVKAKLLLEKNIDSVLVNDRPARVKYTLSGPDLGIILTASMPDLPHQLRESKTAPPLEVEFRSKDRPDMTWAMTIMISDEDIPKLIGGNTIKATGKKESPPGGAGAKTLKPPAREPVTPPQPGPVGNGPIAPAGGIGGQLPNQPHGDPPPPPPDRDAPTQRPTNPATDRPPPKTDEGREDKNGNPNPQKPANRGEPRNNERPKPPVKEKEKSVGGKIMDGIRGIFGGGKKKKT